MDWNTSVDLTSIRYLRRLLSTLGIPEMIVSDNGTSCTGQGFKNLTKGNGTRHLTTPPYHAASNGPAERALQTMKNGLLKQQGKDLTLKLCQFLLKYRSIPCETTGALPAELMFPTKGCSCFCWAFLTFHFDCANFRLGGLLIYALTLCYSLPRFGIYWVAVPSRHIAFPRNFCKLFWVSTA